jgi:hypothetical protein
MNPSQLTQFDGELLDGLQFCSKVYALFEQIRNSDDGVSRLRMRATVTEKKLIEELLPICKYVQSKYKAGRYISVRWFTGSQQFDAEVVQTGAYVERGYFPEAAHLEVTCVMHPNDYLSRELLDKTGGAFGLDGLRRLKSGEIESEPVSYLNQEFIQSYSKLVVKQIEKKDSIAYPPQTTLVVQCSLNRLYMPEEWEALVAEIRNHLPEHSFQEIFMYDMVSDYSCSLLGKY